jgi:hypothetical protein
MRARGAVFFWVMSFGALANSNNNDCYGAGCLPTEILQKKILQSGYYDKYQGVLDELNESNAIAREQLLLERERLNDEKSNRQFNLDE